ncbi:MAG: ATP-binding protein [Planctomycetota bacterium]
MRPLSLRARLAAWFIGLTSLLLVVQSTLLYTSVRASLRAVMDAELEARAEGLVALCEWEGDLERPDFEASEALIQGLERTRPERGREVLLLPLGEVLHRSGRPIPAAELPGAEGSRPRVTFDRRDDGRGRPLRVCTLIAHVAAAPPEDDEPARPGFDVVVRVADDPGPIDARIARLFWTVAGLAGLAILATLIFGAVLSRRLTRPLRELDEAAARVRDGRLAGMPRRGTGDEIDRLAATLDASFGSLRAALERQQRFTANAAHELRTPIAVIRNTAEVGRDPRRDPEEVRAFLADVTETATRMGETVEALLRLARLEGEKATAGFTSVDLGEVARAAGAVLAPPDAKRVMVRVAGAVVVSGRAELLRLVVDNLVSNALRHSDEDEPVSVEVEREGDDVVLRVRDRGPGIPPEEAERVFEPFHRLEAGRGPSDGSGLGLAIVAAVARLHGARCAVEPRTVGASVAVRFPPPERFSYGVSHRMRTSHASVAPRASAINATAPRAVRRWFQRCQGTR